MGWPSPPGLPSRPRLRELLDLGILAICFQHSLPPTEDVVHSICRELVIDVSQNPVRRPWKKDTLPGLCSASRIFSYEHGRVIMHRESLRMLGWRLPVCTNGITQADIGGLLGESMALQPHAAAIWGLLGACHQLLPNAF